MEYKYKLSEQEQRQTLKGKDVPPTLIKRMEDLYGKFDYENDFFSSDLDTYYKTKSVNPETKGINHQVIALASFEESLKQITSAYETLKDLLKADEAKNDSNIVDISKDIKNALNKYRAHLRKFYPEQYKKAMSRMDEGEIDEMSTSAGAGAYLTKYAFKLPKKQKKIIPEGVGATLGPGPKASEDGVRDNAYVKQFKYKLVPKNKNGTYVQKGSGLEVKKLF